MSDYYSIIAKAVHGLQPNTGEARRRLYDRARGALTGEMRNTQLSLDQSEILTARMALEAAITKVEAEVLNAEDARLHAEDARLHTPVKTPVRPAKAPAETPEGRGPLTKLWSQVFRRTGHRAEPTRREPAPRSTPVVPAGRAAAPPTTPLAAPLAASPLAAAPLAASPPAGTPAPPPTATSKGRDTWLTELLARASREEDEDEAMAPPKVRRIR